MSFTKKKIVKAAGATNSELEEKIANYFHELETSANDIKAEIKDLTFTAAKEIEVSSSKKAVIIFVPFKQLRSYHKVQARLVRELEKKLGSQVVIIAQRRIMREVQKGSHKPSVRRPHTRTVDSVHSSMLEDIVYPTEIVGKRTRVRLDSSRLLKVHLDAKEQTNVEHKVDTFSAVYKRLTGKQAVFEFH